MDGPVLPPARGGPAYPRHRKDLYPRVPHQEPLAQSGAKKWLPLVVRRSSAGFWPARGPRAAAMADVGKTWGWGWREQEVFCRRAWGR